VYVSVGGKMRADYLVYLIPLWFIAFYVINDQIRKGSLKKTRAQYSDRFFTNHPPDTTFKAIMAFAIQNRYRVDDMDEKRLAVILNERMTWNSYGSLYPIYVSEEGGGSKVEVGITSKVGKFSLSSPFIQRVLTLRLERMINALKSSMLTYEGTIKM
jgi:hypothetical protein